MPHISFFLLIFVLLTSCTVKRVSSDSAPVSHNIWDTLLQKHISENGLVNYADFNRDTIALKRYLQLLSNNHPNEDNWNQDERLAYWINAYNAFTVKLILDHYPVESIKDIKRGIPFVNTVWDIKFIEIEGQEYDLNNIEHGIIRPRFNEPRIHFALNCASISCPVLAPYAYTADKLDQQLDMAARNFLSDTTRNIVREDELRLSRIFKWYGGDFKQDGNLIEYLNKYAPVKVRPDAGISYLEYDWSLNDYN